MRSTTRTADSHPCVFRSVFIRDQVDPRIKAIWEAKYNTHAPFGNLRRLWKSQHCQTLNPYTSTYCPYRQDDCALAFYAAVETSVKRCEDHRAAVGYFRKVAHSSGIARAENKPLARDSEKGPRNTGAARESAAERSEVPGPSARPTAIGEVLRALDPRSREGSANDGSTGTK